MADVMNLTTEDQVKNLLGSLEQENADILEKIFFQQTYETPEGMVTEVFLDFGVLLKESGYSTDLSKLEPNALEEIADWITSINGSYDAIGFTLSFEGLNLSGLDLHDIDFQRTNFTGANLTNANLTNADLTNADLTNADLTNADLRHATGLHTITFDKRTNFQNCAFYLDDLNCLEDGGDYRKISSADISPEIKSNASELYAQIQNSSPNLHLDKHYSKEETKEKANEPLEKETKEKANEPLEKETKENVPPLQRTQRSKSLPSRPGGIIDAQKFADMVHEAERISKEGLRR